MNIDAKQLGTQARSLWGGLPRSKRLIALIALLGTLGAAVWFSMGQSEARYAVLFAGLSPEDAGELLEQLKQQKVAYRVGANGATIEVPETKALELRVQLAATGLPRGGGVGFEVFDKQTFGTSSFVEQMNYHRALQGELQRTIGALQAVEHARVHLAIAEHSVFRDRDEPPSASVAVRLRPGRHLSREQVRGIVHLVSSSVEGLTPARVTLVDDSGAVLAAGDETAGMEGQQELERGLARRVTDLVERVVGVGRVSVSVAAEMDLQHVEKTEEIYDKDRIALRSESRIVDGDRADGTVSGIAGARGNLPGAPAPAPAVATKGVSGHLQESRNYEVNRTVTKTDSPSARLRRLQVAVLVDERALKGAPAAAIEQITALARTAVGADSERGDRVEVRSIPFFQAPVEVVAEPPALIRWRPTTRVWIGLGASGALVVLLIVALVIRSLRKQAILRPDLLTRGSSFPLPVRELESAIAASERASIGAQPLQLPTRPARDRALDAIRNDGARAAKVIAAWLDEDIQKESGA